MTQDLLFTTPSQIDKARVCIRRWAWDQIDKLPFEQSAEAAFGDRAHKYREDYFRDGTPPDETTQEGRAAAHGLPFLPVPHSNLTPEVKAEFEHGICRVFMRTDLLESGLGQPPEWVAIYDHKFVKDMKKGWHDRAEALNDPQVISYCVWVLKKYPHLDHVKLRWVYTTRPIQSEKTGKWGSIKSEPRDLEVSRAEAFEAWDRVCKLPTEVMYQIRSKKVHPLALPPNADACYMYGPRYACPRVAQCGLTDSDEMKGDQVIMEDLLEQLRALANQAQGTVEAPKEETRSVPKDDIAGRLAGQAVGVNPPPRAVDPATDKVVNAPAKEVKSERRDCTGPVSADAELGRAVRVLFAALRGT